MGRPRKLKTPKQEIAAILRWAEQQGFHNIAAELQATLALLPPETSTKPDKRPRP